MTDVIISVHGLSSVFWGGWQVGRQRMGRIAPSGGMKRAGDSEGTDRKGKNERLP